MNNIVNREYEYTKTVILKNGTIKEYKFKKLYTPADKEHKVTKKKVIELVKTANKEQLIEINKLINQVLNGQRNELENGQPDNPGEIGGNQV